MSCQVTLVYPDYTKPFHIHTDASQFQLGGVISQENKPLAFYSRKLNQAQLNYSTIE
jgi:RNase H-like domain found in reverse transcriptase